MVRNTVVQTTVCIVLTGLLLATVIAAPERQNNDLNRLLEERRDTLQHLVKVNQLRFESGRLDGADDVIRASNLLLEAELDLAASRDERTALHQQLVDNMRKLEAIAEARVRTGQAGTEDHLEAKAARLLAQIQLERAKQAP